MDNVYEIAGVFGIGLLIVGLFFYARFLYRAYWDKDQHALDYLNANLAANLGIPCSALAAFGLVAALYLAYPVQGENGKITIEAFSLKFTGPAGPVMLWVVCFLAFITALKVLRAP